MKEIISLRERYLREDLPGRLGGISSNLARMKSFSSHTDHKDVVNNLIEESKFFIEWSVPDAPLPLQEELVSIQIQLARWQLRWSEIWSDPDKRDSFAADAFAMSLHILELSGLTAR